MNIYVAIFLEMSTAAIANEIPLPYPTTVVKSVFIRSWIMFCDKSLAPINSLLSGVTGMRVKICPRLQTYFSIFKILIFFAFHYGNQRNSSKIRPCTLIEQNRILCSASSNIQRSFRIASSGQEFQRNPRMALGSEA